MVERFDIVVLGGGPAGCATALGLSRLGHRVALVTRPRRVLAIEGLPARTEAVLKSVGLGAALATLGPRIERRASWRCETSTVNRERIVNRARFDAVLLKTLRLSDATVIDAAVGAIRTGEHGATVTLRPSRWDKMELEAGVIVEARGRQAPRSKGRRVAAPETAALVREWQIASDMGSFSATASFDDGWAWFAADHEGQAVLQVFVAGGRGQMPSREKLNRFYGDLIARIPEAAVWLTGARPVGPVIARAAGPVLCEPTIERGVIRVGDAAIALDPLSGHGVFEALGCALAAVPVINTLIRHPERADLAIDFYHYRAGTRFAHAIDVGREFYAGETRWPERPFWRGRRQPLKRQPMFVHWPPDEIVIARRPVVDGHVIKAADVLVMPDHPRGIWRVAGVPVVSLLEFLENKGSSLELAVRRFKVTFGEAAVARDWLRYRGLVP